MPALSRLLRSILITMFVFACFTHSVCALDNGAAPLPPMGFSTWDAFGFNVSSQKLMEWADKIVA